MFEFEITSNCSNTGARTGIFHTPNGQVNTPKFMPVVLWQRLKEFHLSS